MNTLFKGKWVEVREKNGYEYLHNTWCNGVGVAIVPFKKDENGQTIYLGRYENNSAHGTTTPQLCSITGGYDNSDKFTIEQCVLNELEEEGGFRATVNNLIPLGSCKPSKASDGVNHLFAIDLDVAKAQEVEATGDGTGGEVGAYCEWVTKKQAIECQDPLFAQMISRLELKKAWD